ncbi:MAG: zinc ribbon domain-containing protein [Trueperaceae bacterium]|nr:zinc ribbon domain-containing protein [Trueperaceae bacterium]
MTHLKKQARALSTTHYHLCPRCGRATPAAAKEQFCPNDGSKLLSSCPACGSSITSPYNLFCTGCGQSFGTVETP